MSKSKKDWWAAYEEMHKVEKIIRDILGWECFLSWEAYHRKYGDQELQLLNGGGNYTTPTPVAFYVDYMQEWRVFSPDHEDLQLDFDPLHKLKDAWHIIEAISKPVDGSYARYAAFTDALALEKDDQHLTPERICDAALQAIETKKQDVEAPDPGAIDTYIDGLKQVQRLAEVIEEQGTIEGTKEFQRLQWLAERIEKRREQT